MTSLSLIPSLTPPGSHGGESHPDGPGWSGPGGPGDSALPGSVVSEQNSRRSRAVNTRGRSPLLELQGLRNNYNDPRKFWKRIWCIPGDLDLEMCTWRARLRYRESPGCLAEDSVALSMLRSPRHAVTAHGASSLPSSEVEAAPLLGPRLCP